MLPEGTIFIVWHYALLAGVSLLGACIAGMVALFEYREHPSLGPDAIGFDIARSCSITLALFGASCFAAWWAPEILLIFSPSTSVIKPDPWSMVSIISIAIGQISFILMRVRAHLFEHFTEAKVHGNAP